MSNPNTNHILGKASVLIETAKIVESLIVAVRATEGNPQVREAILVNIQVKIELLKAAI